MKSLPRARPKPKGLLGTPPQPSSRPRRRLLLLLLGCLLLAAGGTWAMLELVVWNKLPRDLVGTWVVVEGEMEGATFEFHRDGSMVVREDVGTRRHILKGEAALEDRVLYVTTRDEDGEEVTLAHTIRVLSPRELVLETEQGKLLKLERAEE